MEPVCTRSTCLYDAAQLEHVITRMAQQLVPLLAGHAHVAVIGILRRGAPLADRLCAALPQHGLLSEPLRLDLAIKRYADDLTLLYPETRLTENTAHTELDLTGHALLVVDDVLYSGHSLWRALDYLLRKQPVAIYTAMLADRHVTRLPLRADVVGLHLQVAPPDIVECHVPPYEPAWQIVLRQPLPGLNGHALAQEEP
ncbi:MAG TPA: phosphoribosyltransferase family protein [Chromobacteriaceae bacterium]|nr:phosphoribosyltransferase family protein [Chromobacteriaceae bacterium]